LREKAVSHGTTERTGQRWFFMLEKEKRKQGSDRPIVSDSTSAPDEDEAHPPGGNEITDILAERIKNLEEAIQELDQALASRKALSDGFLAQIKAEMEEIHYHLNHLEPPWKAGFYPQIEFLRLSLHKSLTSRRKDQRTEELKYWEDVIGLLKEKRKFLDEYKALLGTKRRLIE